MKATLALAALLCAGALLPAELSAQQAAPPRFEDGWLGEDKVRHFGASAAITAIGYGGARTLAEHDEAIAVALAAAGAAGILREVHDWRLGKPFSLKDLAWDALGVAAGYLWIREIE